MKTLHRVRYKQQIKKANQCLLGTLVFLTLLANTSLSFSQDSEKPKIKKTFKGNSQLEYRYFFHEGLYEGQHQEYFSAAVEPEFRMDWGKRKNIFQAKIFGRIDQYDNQRTHVDVREFYWQSVWKKWELSVGSKKIFWGYTESNHLVDVINQLDILEGADVENKLGQPMVHLTYKPKWGTLDFMVMPYYRQIIFPGAEGRLRPDLSAFGAFSQEYESEMEEFNPDLAIHWSKSIGAFDLGLSHFYGTSRLPFFGVDTAGNASIVYELINQTGLEMQAFMGNMLWKLEAIYIVRNKQRGRDSKEILAFTAGGEYTFSNLFNTGVDLGLIAEYSYDERKNLETFNNLENDLFLGARLAFNDVMSTDFLGGITIDDQTGSYRAFFEANRRLGNNWKMTLSASFIENVDPEEFFIYAVRKDDFVQFSLTNYF